MHGYLKWHRAFVVLCTELSVSEHCMVESTASSERGSEEIITTSVDDSSSLYIAV